MGGCGMKNDKPKIDNLASIRDKQARKEKKAALKKLRVATGLTKQEISAIFGIEGDN